MMPYLFLVGLSISGVYTQRSVVEEFHELNNQDLEIEFIEKYENEKSRDILAYVYSVKLKQLEYSYNPYTKWTKFKQWTGNIDRWILEDSQSVHLRYIRLLIQEKAPSFLGYNNNIGIDKKILNTKLAIRDDSDYMDVYIRKNTSL